MTRDVACRERDARTIVWEAKSLRQFKKALTIARRQIRRKYDPLIENYDRQRAQARASSVNLKFQKTRAKEYNRHPHDFDAKIQNMTIDYHKARERRDLYRRLKKAELEDLTVPPEHPFDIVPVREEVSDSEGEGEEIL